LIPQHGHAPPRASSNASDGTVGLGVVGPLERTAADLDLALGLLAGPDDADGLGYRFALPPPRHERLAEFRVLLIDTHPLLPTASAIGDALDRVAQELGHAGATVARSSRLLPDLAEAARLHRKLVFAFSQAFNAAVARLS
jgi:amidase